MMTKKGGKDQVAELISFVSEVQELENILRGDICFEAQKKINKIERNTLIAKVEMKDNFKSQLNKLEEMKKLVKDKLYNT